MDSASGGGGTGTPDPSKLGEGPLSVAAPLDSGGGESTPAAAAPPSQYESQKWRDWNTFLQYLRNHKSPLMLVRCSGVHVIEFLKYLDQFGKMKVHVTSCPYFGYSNPPTPCACQLKQAWASLDALIGQYH